MKANYGRYNFFQQSSHQLLKYRVARQMTQYNCCGKNKCSLRYWSSYLGNFNTEMREEYMFMLSGSLCVSFGVTENFFFFLVCFSSRHTFFMLCLFTLFRAAVYLFNPSKQAEQQFYKHNKQSTHPFDIVLLKKEKKKGLARFKIQWGCNLHAKAH